jgi:precorrin-2 dehydrogenase/sirohydrochlorin ferrochelatase
MKGLPVNLLAEGRSCLIVGGGPVAFRKINALLESGAHVRVVSPTLCPELEEFSRKGRIAHVARVFEPNDVKGEFLVFAATNDRAVNRQILDAGKEFGVLCCCVDGNWPDGEFVTPAVLRKGDLTVAVSTGGRSCRQARLVKQNLGRHIEMLETADLLVLGTSHEELTSRDRQGYHLVGPEMDHVGSMISQVWGVHDFMLLNTCNRVELIAVVSRDAETSGILARVMRFDHLPKEKYYRKFGLDAFEHLCLVAAGLLSQSPGECHVTSQLKDALIHASERHWANGMLKEWVSSTLHLSKHIRGAVEPLLSSFEIEDISLQFLEAETCGLAGRDAMIIGAGRMGKSLVRKCVERGSRCVWLYHHNRPEVPAEWASQVSVDALGNMEQHLGRVDFILSATEAAMPVLNADHAACFDAARPVVIVDLGMPRNVNPELDHKLPGVRVTDLDGLKRWHRHTLVRMEEVFDISHKIVMEHKDLYDTLLTSIQGRNAAE